MTPIYLSAAVDALSAARLRENGLELRLVDTTDAAELGSWLQAEFRGFHEGEPSAEELAADLDGVTFRRTTGVWDATIAEPELPVATVSSWPMQLTVPGERSVEAWAVSSVTVAPTHRRRGIARALLEAELRTAAAAGVPLAMLTVTEATIYGRYGFGAATLTAPHTIDSRRARWIGPTPAGRVHFVSPANLLADGPAIVERMRLAVPGEVERWPLWWKKMLGLVEPTSASSRAIRTVRYDDENGVAQGFAVFSVRDKEDYPAGLTVKHLVAASDDAYAALWRFLVEIDLVGDITVPLRSVDEPLPWLFDDRRAAHKVDERDHLWLRILDLEGALEARRYSAPGSFVLEVADPLGFASGTVLVRVGDDGAARVSPADASADGIPRLSLTVNDLATIYLGGVRASVLHRAGRVAEGRPGDAQKVDAAFRSPVAPFTSIWF
ncbi:GNAT family N-acetyltransferase [Compostimonas suwonensis]|uniref:Putative acetyltransferase n=1 Tax=Compostimonas suwonensis TaxID=1048394 RepID=A0A2M9BCI3_9MICO|nr:GNAT family N-acetyltransferase [Compostimonas suwonensis]PJJ55668.1 putative acetyltransferase [Compostimonas suwonensis]